MTKNFLRLGKFFITVALILVIYRYFFHLENLDEVYKKITGVSGGIIFIALISASINWGLEAIKWRILMQNLESLKPINAIRGTLAGAAVSNILPFRVGEYIGRIIYVNPKNHIPAIFNSVLGSTMQFLISITVGIPAILLVFGEKYRGLVIVASMAILVILLIFAFIFYYFRDHTWKKWNWLEKLTVDIRTFRTSQIIRVFLLSAFRYLVFSSFYVFILFQFGLKTDVLHLYAGVATVYLLQSFAPSMILTDAGLRTALPLFVFKDYPDVSVGILSAALFNYCFNILAPSLGGLFIIISQKIKTR